jgi:hypothetical protein
MGDCRVAGDDEIDERDHGRRVGKIAKLRPEVNNIPMRRQCSDIARADAGIEAVEDDARRRKERRDPRELRRPPSILLEARIAAPHQSDAQCRGLRQSLPPSRHSRVVC